MFKDFESRDAASAAAAEKIVADLERRLESQRRASIVVSGGTTPLACFAELAKADLEWARVNVLLSDERWVPADDEASNERLLRNQLLVGPAAAAHFVPMYVEGKSIEARIAELDDEGVRLLPFACALVGMGTDGHFASLFPDIENLELGLDVESRQFSIPVSTAASPHERLSLTLAALSRSDEIVLLIFGEEKRRVLERARSAPDVLPVSAMLWQKRAPVRVYWAP